ncbi:phage tail spike protein [Trueperella pyogenes]|uniref:phage tail spike protein n=1 Tax=Trueperella pyogenes TaxID=1661 RepID=UPI00345CBD48
MITTHNPTLTTGQAFTGSGRQVLDPHLATAEITEELNGAYTLEISWPHNPAVMLEVGDIVAAPVPDGTRQGFRVATLTMDGEQMWHAACHHITFDLATNVIVDAAAVNMTGSQALAHLLSRLAAPHSFTPGPVSNLGPRDSVRWVRKSGLEALSGDDNGILTRWGGDLTRDNTILSWQPRRGRISKVVVWEGKNLASMDKTTDATGLTTRILPVGFDGLTIPEVFVDSPRIGDFPTPLVRVERFEHIKAIKDPDRPAEGELPLSEAQQALREAAKARFTTDHVDVPVLTCEVVMASPEHTTGLEELRLGDTVTVRSSTYGVDLEARVTGYVYNALTNAYTSITLTTGNAGTPRGLAGQMRQLSQSIAARAEESAAVLIAANGSNRSYHQATAPTGARLGDIWFQDDGSGQVNIWIYQATSTGESGWVQVAGDITAAALEAELEAARREVAGLSTDLTGRIEKAQADFQAGVEAVRADMEAGERQASEAIAALDRNIEAAIAQAKRDSEEVDTNARAREEEMAAAFDSARANLEADMKGKADKNGLIAQINASPESELIAGKRLHITGQALIDSSIITTAMIRDAAIVNAKIASLDASKITTGYLSAARLKAGSITSDKLVIAAGFIKTAMIADAAITSAKIASLDAGKITTGTLAAARIAAGSITSDKLSIAAGFIKTAMIADAAITSAKIGSLDAGKITTGTLNAARIGAGSITADKLASNAIQVGLAGWTSTIRITPSAISWYSGSTLEGQITSRGMTFWYGSRQIGWMGEQYKKDYPDIRGITNALEYQGDFVDWAYKKTQTAGVFTTMLSLDPKGKMYSGQPGIHVGTDLRLHGWGLLTSEGRKVILQDCALTGLGTHPGWASANGKAKVVFHTNDLMIVTGGSYYNMTKLMARVGELIARMNSLIGYFNQGWIKTIRNTSGGNITWEYFSSTGWSAMSTDF